MNDPIFNTIKIHHLEVKNRIYLPAMHLGMADNFEVTDQLVDFYAERAKGGAGMITVGYATVDELSGKLPESDRIMDLRNRLSLSQTAWILKNSDLAIGNDCGPMHIADAVRTPSIIIFGPTCELKNAPQNNAITLSIKLPCRPCQYTSRIKTCQNPQCMDGITPEMVIQKIKSLLST